MKQTSLSRALLLAGLVAVAGLAQAETFDVPQQAGEASTMTEGAPNQLTTNSPYGDTTLGVVDTTVLGAAPATVVVPGSSQQVVTTTTYASPVVTHTAPALPQQYSYVLSAPIVANADAVVTQIHRPEIVSSTASAATFDVPTRAGEASTMTGGAPNMVTNNSAVIAGSGAYTTVTPPYYLY